MEELSPRSIARVVPRETVDQAVYQHPVVRIQGCTTQILIGQLLHKLIESNLKFIIAFIEINILKQKGGLAYILFRVLVMDCDKKGLILN